MHPAYSSYLKKKSPQPAALANVDPLLVGVRSHRGCRFYLGGVDGFIRAESSMDLDRVQSEEELLATMLYRIQKGMGSLQFTLSAVCLVNFTEIFEVELGLHLHIPVYSIPSNEASLNYELHLGEHSGEKSLLALYWGEGFSVQKAGTEASSRTDLGGLPVPRETSSSSDPPSGRILPPAGTMGKFCSPEYLAHLLGSQSGMHDELIRELILQLRKNSDTAVRYSTILSWQIAFWLLSLRQIYEVEHMLLCGPLITLGPGFIEQIHYQLAILLLPENADSLISRLHVSFDYAVTLVRGSVISGFSRLLEASESETDTIRSDSESGSETEA